MKRRLRVYKKTVSIVNETAIGMYESLVGNKKDFFWKVMIKIMTDIRFWKEPEEIITSRGDALVIRQNDGTEEIRQGNPLERLKEYYSEFDIVKENEELSFPEDWSEIWDMILSAMQKYCRITIQTRLESRPSR